MPTDWSWYTSHCDVDGKDIVVRNAIATYFGDPMDAEDNGVGASGFETARHPEYLGCSLPFNTSALKVMKGCPIPRLPWYTPVKVYLHKTKIVVYTHLIDLGPHPKTKHHIDLTVGTLRALGLSRNDGVYDVDFRIIDAALRLPKNNTEG